MKVLLDECLPVDFRHEIRGHEAHTVQWAGFKSKKNGELLEAAEKAGYKVFITVDQGLPHQARTDDRRIAVLLIRARTNQIEDLLPLATAILSVIETIEAGQVVSIG